MALPPSSDPGAANRGAPVAALHSVEFVPLLVHDLKAPLSAILLSANLLASEKVGPLAPQQRDLVQMIAKSCERIQRLLDDLADVARLEAGTSLTLGLSTEPIGPMMDAAVADVAAMAEEKRVTVGTAAAAVAPPARVDCQRIARVLATVLTVLLKFTPAGGRVELSVADEERARLRIGLRAPLDGDAADRVLEVLAETDQRLQQLGATNELGWIVAEAVAQAHGGALRVRREPAGVSISFSVGRAEAGT